MPQASKKLLIVIYLDHTYKTKRVLIMTNIITAMTALGQFISWASSIVGAITNLIIKARRFTLIFIMTAFVVSFIASSYAADGDGGVDIDTDNDSFTDAVDVDDDGDGLIEIATVAQLNQVRHNLLGSGFKASAGDVGDETGCGGQDGITECNGYELAANISLADYANWQPIGSCSNYDASSRRCENRAALFNAIFDGNGYTISDITITNPAGDYANAAGLFGAISPASILRNIHILSAHINGGGKNVGLLVGYALEANIANSSAAGEVSGTNRVGGLVGNGYATRIMSSYAVIDSVHGGYHVGGLVGYGWDARISSSYAVVGNVSGRGDNFGGLVGNGVNAKISSSYAVVGNVSGRVDNIGGLVGNGWRAKISSSYAVVGSVSGRYNVGGMVGYGEYGTISSSYAVSRSVRGTSNVGGLVGRNNSPTNVIDSYWDSDTSVITTGRYGLPQTTRELQSPTNATGIYANWITTCADGSRAWDFGTSSQYPSLICTPGKLTTQRLFAVTGLRVIPGEGSATIIWNNPDAQIASISISYKITGSDDTPLTKSSTQIIPDAKNVQETINDLSDRVFYNFTVSLTLRGDAAGKEGEAPSIIAAIGPNYDGDGLVDFLDPDDDNDGVEDSVDACDSPGAATSWISDRNTDYDGDGCRNSDEDADDNGNGLIEIYNARELDLVREDLAGRSFSGDRIGCGGQGGITECNGYELAANISLADYANWQPIGSCSNYEVSSRRCENRAALFNTTFDGNGYTIRNLNIANPIGDYANGAGLFGAISPAAVLRNIHIRSANISGGGMNVGLLVGYALEANIANSSAAGEVSGTNRIGGLVGNGYAAKITSSYAAFGSVSGSYSVGGLVGYGGDAKITSSYAAVGSVSGRGNNVGGLVGDGRDAEITSSYAAVGNISGRGDNVGGLVGDGGYGTISSSYTMVGFVDGSYNVGGLVGYGAGATISSSYTYVASVSGRGDNVGGLIGYGAGTTISSSYAAVGYVSGDNYVAGLVGRGNYATNIIDSYWDSDTSGIATGSYGLPKTTAQLRNPTGYVGIYTNWITTCADGSRAWNFGTSSQYPALACGPDEITAQRSSFAVTGLRVIPGEGSATIIWNNPYAPIASISISYKITGSDDVQYFPLITDRAKTSANAIDVRQPISGLTNGEFYNFTVDLTLSSIYADRRGEAPSIIAAIGPDYDGDGLVDFLDLDDDNDGVEDSVDACDSPGAATSWISDRNTDYDGDGCRNSDEDADDNGNGLIEIYNARELDLVREDLAGRSFSGDGIGCGGQGGITECNGYELAANISLADYANWQPIGSCSNYEVSSRRCENRAALFNTTFDGNGYTIRNLNIANPIGDYANGAGLFGAISPAAVLRNIHIRSANISGGGMNVGLLVGYAWEANIANSSAAGEVSGSYSVGGLVGSGYAARITSSYAAVGSVSGSYSVGGLVGDGRDTEIASSYAVAGNISGRGDNVGGLVGYGGYGDISSSYASVGSVGGSYNVGGLVGYGGYGTISSSYASGGSASGTNRVGGLVGYGSRATISSSYAAVGSVSGDNYVGGLVGRGNYATNIIDSYWDSDTSGIATGSYGLPKTTAQLRNPTGYVGIYANWITTCADGSRAWNFGTSSQYPALACAPEEIIVQHSSFAVTGLRVIPGEGSATIIWNNPDAQIASISISYKITGSDDVQYFPLITDRAKTSANAIDVRQPISGLTNGEFYNFTVDLTLSSIYIGREGEAPSIIAAIGPDYDDDDLVDFLDLDDDNDGVEDNADACDSPGAAASWISDRNTDFDGDGCRNSDEDADDNGNGLIEIHNARELDLVREDLAGISFSGDGRGCGGQGGITECNGYELAANISLADYANWQPIGSCSNYDVFSRRCENRAALFNTIFDGNGYTIRNLTITNPTGDYANGAGLFGAISPAAVLRNIHIRSANISGGGMNVGLLVGYALEANIANSSAAGEVSGSHSVGGLVGNGLNAEISSSYASVASVSGTSRVGGLVGYGLNAEISSSYAAVGSVSGSYIVGGLVGYGLNAKISSSYASGASVSGTSRIGGLVGDGAEAEISSSYAVAGNISGSYSVGGLVGDGDGADITYSYWDSDTSGITTGTYGEPKTTRELQMPTSFGASVYATWKMHKCDDGITHAWNLGTNFQYPSLTCTPGKLTTQRSYAKVRRSYAVTGLRVIPGEGSATIIWNNPYAPIASINISYKITGSDDTPLTKSSTQITPDAKNAQETINDLSNGVFYNFTVSLTLRGDAAGKEGEAPSIIVAIGPDYDGDDLVDFLDLDDDNDGVEDSVDACDSPGAATSWISDRNTDYDGDGCRNSDEDVDDNGNGLIEIHNARELDLVREDLAGRSFSGDGIGCGGQGGITECNGYELAANISLADYANWQPIGSCSNYEVSSRRCENRAALFNTTFDGNGYTIRNLNIANPIGDYANGAGLFGAISPAAVLRNIHIRSANISGGGMNVGLLVGYALEANIANSSAAGEVSGTNYVGGLVGNGYAAKISSSYASVASVSGTNRVGGLVGNGERAYITSSYAVVGAVGGSGYNVGGLVGYGGYGTITSSYASVASVSGSYSVGGLVGYWWNAEINSSYASVASVSGRNEVGGLVGYGGYGTISSSYASVASVSGTNYVGGLAGDGWNAKISSSYASVASVSGTYIVGGLVGYGRNAKISSSYAVAGNISGSYSVGGLVGDGDGADITYSYWDSDTSGITTGTYGEPKTTRELQMPTSFGASVYATWKMHKCDDGITHAWNLGTNFQYPSLTCTPGKLTTQRSYAKVRRSYAVTGLRVIPGEGSATIIWNNPYAPIASINISYKITGSDDTPLTKSSTQITPDAKNAQETINDLSDRVFYNFTVSLTLRGDAAGKEGEAPSIIAAIGPDYDGDGLVDFLDLDDDNDGVEDNADACDSPGAATSWISDRNTDYDGDGCRNSDEDADDNGNGLIEIHNARELDLVREDLAGRSFSGDGIGCGGQGGITECNGYELAANISLADYANWQPIGSCSNYEVSSRRCENRAALFNTTFDGNGYTIRNLNIANPIGDYANGAGLFGAISPAAVLRNIHIRSANISGGGMNVGLLVGYALEANIANSSAAGEVSGTNYVGGLVGNGYAAKITSSYAAFGSVSGSYSVGGLVGYGGDARITSSYAAVGSVSGSYSVGGLVGDGRDAEIMSSYAAVGNISGRGDNVGGLVGYGGYGDISSSYASVGYVGGSYNVGGLVGYGGYGTISSSYASGGSVSGTNRVGGLVGYGSRATISSSYAAVGSVSGDNYVGGLVGRGNYATNIIDSYWDSDTSGIATGSYGLPKTTAQLRNPTGYVGIYANWITTCADGSRAWDFGTSSQYPSLTCTPGKLTTQRSYAKVRRSYAVTGLRVIPGEGSATIIWNNPYAPIASINISYKITGSDDTPLTKSSTQITPDAKNAQETINDLSDRVFYNFTVSLTLRGDAAGKEGEAPSIIAAIGPDYDGDGLVDFLDLDDDNDGVEDNADACDSPGAATSWISDRNTDYDGDGCRNSDEDADDNGNGLIEIHNARELDLVREDLAGRSFSGDGIGCGGQGGITECNGYELAANISLADYANWQPIGSCSNYEVSSRRCENRAALFNTTFDGNGYTIRNLNIANPIGDYANGAGLFGAISPAAVLRNIHIRSANISGGGMNVGLLVGYALEANIANSSAAGEVSGTNYVGGLVGYGYAAKISSSYASVASVSGTNRVGGLVGNGERAYITSSYAVVGAVGGSGYNVGGLVGYGGYGTITSSYASVASVSGSYSVGGLVGYWWNAEINSSYASVASVSGRNEVGGLVGYGGYGTISSSYASVASVSGTNYVGGLAGYGWNAKISSSYASVASVSGTYIVGGLVGYGRNAKISSSYAVAGNISGSYSVGGLVGDGDGADITYSYWDSDTSGITTGSFGLPQTTAQLRNPTDSVGIYTNWDEECDDGSRAWNFGIANQYPVLTCTPGGVDAQRR